MTNDASRSACPAPDWERAALERVAAQRIELQDARADESAGMRGLDWEQRAVERLRRYFRTRR